MKTLLNNLEKQLAKMEALKNRASDNYIKYRSVGKNDLARSEWNKADDLAIAVNKLKDSIHYVKNALEYEL